MISNTEAKLLVSVPALERRHGNEPLYVYVILLPANSSADEIVQPHYYYNNETIFPLNLRKWYEKAVKLPSNLNPELVTQILWEGSPESHLTGSIRRYKNDFGCAVFEITDAGLLARHLMVSVFAGPLLVARATFPPLDRRLHSLVSYGQWTRHTRNNCQLYFRFDSTGNFVTRVFGLFPVHHRIFASYAREDLPVVEAVNSVVSVLNGVHFVWDLNVLRSGDTWDVVLRKEIHNADSFQVFWSTRASKSPHVEAEWRYALSLKRKRFINPVYWNQPLPKIPSDLAHLHFAFLEFPGIQNS